MSNFRVIPLAQKELICRLSLTLEPHRIAYHTGISARTVRRILRLWRLTGKAYKMALQMGRPRALTGFDISVGAAFLFYCDEY